MEHFEEVESEVEYGSLFDPELSSLEDMDDDYEDEELDEEEYDEEEEWND